MTLQTGTRLGPYEIVAPIGAGGMGEVYRARDTRLDRQVAVKILPEGESLAERLVKGPLPLSDVLNSGVQIADQIRDLATFEQPNQLSIG